LFAIEIKKPTLKAYGTLEVVLSIALALVSAAINALTTREPKRPADPKKGIPVIVR
jgi:hypothetical protein